jgi:hypothetical protein
MSLDPIKTRHLFRLGKHAATSSTSFIGDTGNEELRKTLKQKLEDKPPGKRTSRVRTSASTRGRRS